MPTPYEQSGFIGGQMPAMGAAAPIGGSPGAIQAGYSQAYNTALQANQGLYNNILSGYQNVAAGQRTAQQALAAGYSGLAGQIGQNLAQSNQQAQGTAGWYGGTLGEMYGRQSDIDQRYQGLGQDVQGRLDPMAAAGRQYGGANQGLQLGYDRLSSQVVGAIQQVGGQDARDIQENYARQAARADQSAISRGLGNATVRDSLQRGIAYDQSRANLDLTERLARLRADYGSQLGLAGLGFGERAAQGELGQQNLEAQTRAGYAASIGQNALGFRERAGANQVAQANLQTGALSGLQQQLGQQQAAYGSGIGLAGLAQQGRDVGENAALAGRQLDWMNSVSAPYPNAALYAQLAQQAGLARGGRLPPGLEAAQQGGGLQRIPSSGGQVPGFPRSSLQGPQYGADFQGYGPAFAGGTPLNAGITAGPPADEFGNAGYAARAVAAGAPEGYAARAAAGAGGYGGGEAFSPDESGGYLYPNWQNLAAGYAPAAAADDEYAAYLAEGGG